MFGGPTATFEVVRNTGNLSSEKPDVGFGSSYLNAFSPQDLGRCHWIEVDEITHGGHPRRYDRPADQLEVLGFQTQSRFMRTQLISCRLPKADSALLRSSLFHHLCRFVSFSSGGLASARESLCRGLGSRWFTERFHRNALVTHFQHGQVFCTARQLKDYAVTRCRLHQRAPQR